MKEIATWIHPFTQEPWHFVRESTGEFVEREISPIREVRKNPQEVQRVRNKMWDESRGRFREGGEDHNLQSRDRHPVEPGIEGNHFDLAILDDIFEEDNPALTWGNIPTIPTGAQIWQIYKSITESPQEKQKRLNKEWNQQRSV